MLRKGSLAFLDAEGAEEPLTAGADGTFRLGEDEQSPERVRFSDVLLDGQCLRFDISGNDYNRFFTP